MHHNSLQVAAMGFYCLGAIACFHQYRLNPGTLGCLHISPAVANKTNRGWIDRIGGYDGM